MVEYVWGYSSILWQFLMINKENFFFILDFTKKLIYFTFKVHLSFFSLFPMCFITFFNTSTFYLIFKNLKVFNNYLMSNMIHGYSICHLDLLIGVMCLIAFWFYVQERNIRLVCIIIKFWGVVIHSFNTHVKVSLLLFW